MLRPRSDTFSRRKEMLTVFASDLFFHFVFDADHDPHYTDSLLKLSPAAYLWYELRRQHGADNILFVNLHNGSIRAEVFDTQSNQILRPQKKGFFGLRKTEDAPQAVAHAVCQLAELGQQEDTFLDWLLNDACPKNKKTALVFSHDAFTRLCTKSSGYVISQLKQQIQSPTGRCIIVIRLPVKADELARVMLPGDGQKAFPVLWDLFDGVRGATIGNREALMTALERQLGRQMTQMCLCPDDTMRLLLHHAVTDGADTLEQLEDQAEYLDLCRRYRVGLLAPDTPADRFAPVSRLELSNRLDTPGFRDQLRQHTAKLRQKYPDGTLADALREARKLPQMPPPFPVYQDELARNILGLDLPDTFPRKAACAADLDRARRDLTTLWNKPRNQLVCEAANTFCAEARSAIESRDWDTLGDVLHLLSFCGKQVCADTDHNDNLQNIINLGTDTIRQSKYLFTDHTFARSAVAQQVHETVEWGDRHNLQTLRALLRENIAVFDKPDISAAAIRVHLERSAERQRAALAHTEQTVLAAQQQQAALRQQKEEEARLRAFHQRFSLEEEPEDTTEEIPYTDADRQSAWDLLEAHHLF